MPRPLHNVYRLAAAGLALLLALLLASVWNRSPRPHLESFSTWPIASHRVAARSESPPRTDARPNVRVAIRQTPVPPLAQHAPPAVEAPSTVVETVASVLEPAIEPLADDLPLLSSRSIDAALIAERQRIERRPPDPAVPPTRFVVSTPSLVPLYASFAALQAADAITTQRALRNPELQERNPIVGRFARSTTGMVVLKAATTAVTVVAVEKLRKRNRVAAVATMMGINAAYMVIVSRNAAVVRSHDD